MPKGLNNCWTCFACQIMALAAVIVFNGCEHTEAPAPTAVATAPPKAVTLVPARLEPWPETIRVQGSLMAYEDAIVGSKLAGRVAAVAVDVGSIVKAGEPLVQLVRTELDLRVQLAEAQLQQACAVIGITADQDESQFQVHTAPGVMLEQAQVNMAQSSVDRAKRLVESRAIAEEEYDTLVAQLKAAQARYRAAVNLVGEQVSTIGVRRKELALARQAVVDSQVLAPFAGIVGERRVSPGEFVQAGQAVVTLVRADRLRFTAGVPESRAAAVRVGQRVEIELGERDSRRLVAAISRVSPTVSQSSRSILIEVDVPNPKLDLQAGLFAEAELVVNPTAQAVVVPASAVSRFAGVSKVWIVDQGKARQQTVRTGREDTNRVEILDGLRAGSMLVRAAADGHEGPVIAAETPAVAPLQSQLPKAEPAVLEGTNGAQ